MSGAPSDPARPASFRFPSAFRLKRKRLIAPLFDRTRKDVETVATGSIRLVYRLLSPEEGNAPVPLQVGFTMGRGVRRAVERNRIKRLLRETYRLNQHVLLEALAGHDRFLTLMVIFRGQPDRARRQVPAHLPRALQQLAAKIQEGSTP